MVEYKLISTGSKGNAIIYENTILVDCGVSYKLLADEISDVKILLLTHDHADHVRIPVLKRLVRDLPNLVIMCGQWLEYATKGLEKAHVVICEENKMYKVGNIIVSPVSLYHDVKNYGWRIFINDKKIFHATDTVKLDGIVAKEYDLYAIEYHHDTMIIEKQIEDKLNAGQFCYEIGAKNSHLSFQDANKWINENKGANSQVIKLHYSNCYQLIDGELRLKDEQV